MKPSTSPASPTLGSTLSTPITDKFDERLYRAGEPDWEDLMEHARQLERDRARLLEALKGAIAVCDLQKVVRPHSGFGEYAEEMRALLRELTTER